MAAETLGIVDIFSLFRLNFRGPCLIVYNVARKMNSANENFPFLKNLFVLSCTKRENALKVAKNDYCFQAELSGNRNSESGENGFGHGVRAASHQRRGTYRSRCGGRREPAHVSRGPQKHPLHRRRPPDPEKVQTRKPGNSSGKFHIQNREPGNRREKISDHRRPLRH